MSDQNENSTEYAERVRQDPQEAVADRDPDAMLKKVVKRGVDQMSVDPVALGDQFTDEREDYFLADCPARGRRPRPCAGPRSPAPAVGCACAVPAAQRTPRGSRRARRRPRRRRRAAIRGRPRRHSWRCGHAGILGPRTGVVVDLPVGVLVLEPLTWSCPHGESHVHGVIGGGGERLGSRVDWLQGRYAGERCSCWIPLPTPAFSATSFTAYVDSKAGPGRDLKTKLPGDLSPQTLATYELGTRALHHGTTGRDLRRARRTSARRTGSRPSARLPRRRPRRTAL